MLVKIERFVFFPVVRFVAFICALVLLLAIVGGAIFFATFKGIELDKANISFTELQAYVNPESNEIKRSVPKNLEKKRLEKYAGQEMEQDEYENWINRYTNTQLKKLSKIVAEAEKKEPGNVLQYIQTYDNLYWEKLNRTAINLGLGRGVDQTIMQAIASIQETVQKILNTLIKGVVASAIIVLFLLFTIIIVLLLLLSIEKNTRKET
ncbi:hypothetical protein FACS189445_4290 [Spirochaetia bacterium]|nr:hypothetical protein FACS189445_4290 [Spirochaetia bacterium]